MTDLARILVGPLAWLAAFSAVYGLHGMACGLGWDPALAAALRGTAFAAAIMLQAGILVAHGDRVVVEKAGKIIPHIVRTCRTSRRRRPSCAA